MIASSGASVFAIPVLPAKFHDDGNFGERIHEIKKHQPEYRSFAYVLFRYHDVNNCSEQADEHLRKHSAVDHSHKRMHVIVCEGSRIQVK